MRRIIVSALLLGLTVMARGQEGKALDVSPDGSFAPHGAVFRVMFRLANMVPAPVRAGAGAPSPETKPPGNGWAREWSSEAGGLARLELCNVQRPLGLGEVTLAAARLRVSNPTDHPFSTTLAVAIVPQGPIYGLSFEKHAFAIEGRLVLVADTPSRGAILGDSAFAPRPLVPANQAHVESAKGECRGEMIFDLTLQPGQTQTFGFLCPVKLPEGKEPDLDFYRGLSVEELFAQAEKERTGP
jgi:hypothetical protein